MLEELTIKIINGYRLTRQDDLTVLLHADLSNLRREADNIRMHYCGSQGELCTIINGKSGRCSEDCKFCAQSSHYNTTISAYEFLPETEILKNAMAMEAKGIKRYSIVTAGKSLTPKELAYVCQCYSLLKTATNLNLCASHGLLNKTDFRSLKSSGVTRYHANIETSRRNFPNICTTHTYQQKLTCIQHAKAAGLEVCAGGILGLSETLKDRIDMAFDLQELEVDSIPLNILTPIPGTPFMDVSPLPEEEILRSVAIFRFICPTAAIRLAAGRSALSDNGQLAFRGGANAAITGDMLTTTGTTIHKDQQLFQSLQFS